MFQSAPPYSSDTILKMVNAILTSEDQAAIETLDSEVIGIFDRLAVADPEKNQCSS